MTERRSSKELLDRLKSVSQGGIDFDCEITDAIVEIERLQRLYETEHALYARTVAELRETRAAHEPFSLRLAAERVRDHACTYGAPADSVLVKRELIGELAQALGGSITDRPAQPPSACMHGNPPTSVCGRHLECPDCGAVITGQTKPAALDDEALIDRAWNRYRDGIRCVHCDGTGYDAEHACEFCDASGVTPPRKCALPPEGWECSRGDGHDGRCAATQWAKSPKGNRCLNPSACLRAADGTECWPCDHGGARHE